jgi:predicted RNase H-like nuclease (RuvC/YqgF family)
MVENKKRVTRKDLEDCEEKSEMLERTIDIIKNSLEKLEGIVDKLEEECYKSTYKNVEFEYRIEFLERKLKEKDK